MADPTFPRVVATRRTRLSPWATLVEKDVQFAADGPLEVYHCMSQADYVGVIALTDRGTVPVVRQFRPAVGMFTWEFPAGTIDDGESADDAARRELLEETGLRVDELVSLGPFMPDTGRLDVTSHGFFARASAATHPPPGEAGLEVKFVTIPELRGMMQRREFAHQLHWGLYAAALIDGVCPELG